MSYAKTTSVAVSKTRGELEDLLTRHGADAFMFASGSDCAAVMFRLHDRSIRFVLPLPERGAAEFKRTAVRNKPRGPDQALKAWEQACRSRWRALLLVVKAKLEAIAIGISTVEHEFLAWMVTPDGPTIGEQLIPRLPEISSGESPLAMLTLGGGAS